MKTPEELFIEKQEKMTNEELIELVDKQISDLASSYGKSHRMSIPPMISDTDMLLSEMVRRFKNYIHLTAKHDAEMIAFAEYILGFIYDAKTGKWEDVEGNQHLITDLLSQFRKGGEK